jgi:hypothetical protein
MDIRSTGRPDERLREEAEPQTGVIHVQAL